MKFWDDNLKWNFEMKFKIEILVWYFSMWIFDTKILMNEMLDEILKQSVRWNFRYCLRLHFLKNDFGTWNVRWNSETKCKMKSGI